MRKLILLIFTLLLGVTASWADPTVVTLANWNNDVSNFGNFSNSAGGSDYYTFTTTGGSYLAGVTLTSPNSDIKIANGGKPASGYGYCMKFTSIDAAAHTLQLSAPSGYVIESYVIALRSNSSSSGSFTVTAADGTYKISTIGDVNTSNSGYPILHVTSVESQTTTLTMQAQASGKILYVPYFSVVVRPSGEVKNVNKTFIYHQYVTLADNTMTTNAYSGLSGVTVTTDGLTLSDTYVNNTYGQCIGVTASDTEEHTMTITAPEGYIVRGYTIFLKGSQSANPATYTAVDETSASSTTGGVTMTVNNLTSRSTTIKVKFTVGASTTYFPRFFVNIQKRVDAISGISSDKKYNIYNHDGVWAVASGASVVNSTNELSLAFMASDQKQQFAFVYYDGTDDDTDNGSYYLYSVSEKKFAYVDGTKLSLTEYFTDDVAASPVTFESSTNDTYKASSPVVIQIGGESFGVSSGYSPDIYKYSPHLEDGGNASAIYEVGAFDDSEALAQIVNTTTVAYHVIYDGMDKRNESVYAMVGDELSIPSSLTWYGMAYESFYSDDKCTSEITTVPVGGGIVYAKETWNVPVKFTATASAPEYYNLNIRSQYLVYNSEATGQVTLQSTSEPFNNDASWAFIGDPYTGFKLINKTKGTDQYLTYTSVVTGRHSANNIGFIADASFDGEYWYIDKNTGGFCLRMKENPNIYFHHDSSKNYLRTCSKVEWGSVHNDAGSTIVASTDEEVLFALYDSMKNWSFGTSIGQMNTTDASTVTNEEAASTVSGVDAAILGEMTAAYPDCYNYLMTIKNNMALVEPTAGYYRLKNVATDKYLTATATGGWNSSAKGVFANGSNTDASTVIRLFDKDSNGTLYMYNQGYGFGWTDASMVSGSGGVAWITASPDKYVHWFPGKAANQIAFAICYGNGVGSWASYLNQGIYTIDSADESVIGGTDATDDKAQWEIEDATSVTIRMNPETSTMSSYATICFPFDVTIETPGASGGAFVYTVGVEGSRARLNELGSQNVPAGTPVLLVGAYATTNVTATITSGLAAYEGTNDLRGTYFDKTSLEDNEYAFGLSEEDELGFWKLKTGNKVGANKAYLVVPSGGGDVKGYAFAFDDETGITEVSEKAEVAEGYFDLSGRRIQKPAKGLYIKNGKKVVIK